MAVVRLVRWLALSVVCLVGCVSTPVERAAELLSLQQQAESLYQQGKCEGAMSLYRQLAKEMPREAEPWLRIGNCQARLEQVDAAIAAYREAIERNPSYNKAWHNLAYIQAQQLARTAAAMAQHVDPADPSSKAMRELAMEVLAPFQRERVREQQ